MRLQSALIICAPFTNAHRDAPVEFYVDGTTIPDVDWDAVQEMCESVEWSSFTDFHVPGLEAAYEALQGKISQEEYKHAIILPLRCLHALALACYFCISFRLYSVVMLYLLLSATPAHALYICYNNIASLFSFYYDVSYTNQRRSVCPSR